MEKPTGQGTGAAFAYVTTLFFAWGFVTSTLNPLVPAVRSIFTLSVAEALLTESAWFIAYGLVSLPAAALLARLGFVNAILAALATMVAGCLMIPVATELDLYPGVLLALFVIASGVTLLQVAANPLSAALGAPERAHFRLNFSQAFNSLGTVFGPRFGAFILLSGGLFSAGAAANAAAQREESLRSIDIAFLIIAALFAALAILIWTARKRIAASAPSREPAATASPLRAFRSGWALFGALAIFLYVGSEVAIGGMLTNFLHDSIGGITMQNAGEMVSFYWLGAMIGRFVGSAVLTRVPPGIVLSAATLIAAALCFTVTQTGGATAAYVALTIGFFNSIMFPTIFTMTLERSSAPTSATSGLLCMAIVGGAVLPYIAGRVVDAAGVFNPAFFVPMIGYLGVATFAIAAARTPATAPVATAAASGH
jgi:FHS family L-fucose permease-like MFS transporter